MTTNLKSEILDNINNIALGVNTDSSLRNKLLVQLEQAESTNAFDFKIDVNFINRDKKSYVAKYLTIHQLNKIGNSELKQLRDRFQESYLQVQWKSKDKESKSKIDALRDALNSYVPISINKKTGNVQICGWLPKEEFLNKASFFEKGSVRERSNGTRFTTGAPLYELENNKLNQINSVEDLKNVGV